MAFSDIKALTDRIISTEFYDRELALQREKLRIERQHNARGLLRSSATFIALTDLCHRELNQRALIALNAYKRVLAASGEPFDLSLSEYVLADLLGTIKSVAQKLEAQLIGWVSWADTKQKNKITENFRLLISNIPHKMRNDIALLRLAASNQDAAFEKEGPDVVARVSARTVPTDDHNIAKLDLKLEHKDREAILAELEEVTRMISYEYLIDHVVRDQLCQVIEELKLELAKPKGNWQKLYGFLFTVSQAIRDIPALKKSSEVLQDTLERYGVFFP